MRNVEWATEATSHPPLGAYLRDMVKRRPSRLTALVPERNRLFYAFWATGAFLVTIWSVYALNEVLELGWRAYGVRPGEWEHWTGKIGRAHV